MEENHDYLVISAVPVCRNRYDKFLLFWLASCQLPSFFVYFKRDQEIGSEEDVTDEEEEKEERDNKGSEDEDDKEDDGQDNDLSDKEEELENDKNAEGSVTALNKEADKKKRKLLEKYTSSPGSVFKSRLYCALLCNAFQQNAN